jgi:Domain of unknown function (DUF4276)
MVGRILYVEGGGDGKALRSQCREGFRRLLERAGCDKRMPRIVACGGRMRAFQQFEATLRSSEASAILLVDAEAPVEGKDPWDHVRRRPGDGWQRPTSVSAEQLHLMVQLMETWLLADRQTLADFFGSGFREAALPGRAQVEEIPKRDVMSGICEASRGSRKGEYHKGTHSFTLLGRVDPARLSAASPWARRFFEYMRYGSPR